MSEDQLSGKMTGEVVNVGDVETFKNDFTKRTLVINVGGKWPQEIKFSLIKDRCELADGLSEGDEVTLSYNIRGNQYKDKWYVDLECWKLEEGQKKKEEPVEDDEKLPF